MLEAMRTEHDFCDCHHCSIVDPERYWAALKKLFDGAPRLPEYDEGPDYPEPLL